MDGVLARRILSFVFLELSEDFRYGQVGHVVQSAGGVRRDTQQSSAVNWLQVGPAVLLLLLLCTVCYLSN